MSVRKQILWAISFAIASLIVLVDVGQDYIHITMHNNNAPNVPRLILWASIWWYSWAFFAVPIFQLSSRFLISRERWRSSLLIHMVGCIVIYIAHVGVQVLSMSLPVYSELHPTLQHAVSHHAGTSIFLNVVIYWSAVGASHAVIYYSQFKKREVKTAQLEAALHRAQLDALKMQLQPHFLFNTLNAISTLTHRDPLKADHMIAQLGELLRKTIDQTHVNEVTLHEEIDFIKKYLDIEQARFEDRLVVHYHISPDAEHASIPFLVLQPLVENAIKHGVSRMHSTGVISIHALRDDSQLVLKVIDNGPGLASPNGLETGTGITNTRERLDTLFRDAYSLSFGSNEPHGMTVTLRLPFIPTSCHSSRPLANHPNYVVEAS